DAFDRIYHRLGVLDHKAGDAGLNYLGYRAAVKRNHRAAGRHGLNKRKAERFAPGYRMEEALRLAHELVPFLFVDFAYPLYAIAEARLDIALEVLLVIRVKLCGNNKRHIHLLSHLYSVVYALFH